MDCYLHQPMATPMTMTKRLGALIAFVAISMLTPRADAAVATAASFDDKVEHSAAIVMARCIKTESRMDTTGRWILTYSTFDVEKSIKGSTGQQITLVTPGGELNGIRQETIGVPAFQPGDENVLFLKNTKLGPTVLYFDQGAYGVRADDRGEKMITPIASNLVKVDAQSGKAAAVDDEPRTLASFDHAVRESMQNGPDRRMRMEALQARKTQQSSLWSVLAGNKLLVALAVVGAALATWQLLRR